MLYSEMALEQLGDISDEQMTTIITEAIASTNEAFINSDIDVHYRLVHVAKVWMKPFEGRLLHLPKFELLFRHRCTHWRRSYEGHPCSDAAARTTSTMKLFNSGIVLLWTRWDRRVIRGTRS